MDRKRQMAFAAVAVVAGAAAAFADITDPVVTFSASSSLGSGSYTVSLSDGAWDGDEWFWMAPQPIEIRSDSGALILTITGGSAFVAEDPVIALGFSVFAGAADTDFSIDSGTLSFPEIEDAIGRASAGYTLTESNGDTATLTGLEPGGSLFTATYNTTSTFANLLFGPFVEGDAFGSEAGTDEFPGGGAFTLVGDTTDISVRWGFRLTAEDQASGTSVFVVVPAPASMGAMAVIGLGAMRRRR